MNYLKRDELVVGKRYKVDARNFSEATWNGEVFEGLRTKFGQTFESTEIHYDDHKPHGTVKPLEVVDG